MENMNRHRPAISRSFKPEHISKAVIAFKDIFNSNIHWVSLNYPVNSPTPWFPWVRQQSNVMESLPCLQESRKPWTIDLLTNGWVSQAADALSSFENFLPNPLLRFPIPAPPSPAARLLQPALTYAGTSL